MCSLTMNSIRASPTPSLGRREVRNATEGLPRLTCRRVRVRGSAEVSTCSRRIGTLPAYTRPTSPSAQLTVTVSPSVSAARAPVAPTTAGMPSSRATMAA